MAKKQNGNRATGTQRATNTTTRVTVDQTTMPRMTLEESISIARTLVEEFAGAPTAPHDIAMALNISPTSTSWQRLTGASIAYGLTAGGYNAKVIALTDLGRRVANADRGSLAEAVLRPRVLSEFFKRYDRQKFPSDSILPRVLQGLGVPSDRLSEASNIVRQNGIDAGIIREIKTGLFVALNSPVKADPELLSDGSGDDVASDAPQLEEPQLDSSAHQRAEQFERAAQTAVTNRKVFISHGRDRTIVGQIKEILTFGKFEPVVSVEREKTAVPVPAKVFSDMRECAAGVIHVMVEEVRCFAFFGQSLVLNLDGSGRAVRCRREVRLQPRPKVAGRGGSLRRSSSRTPFRCSWTAIPPRQFASVWG